MANYYGNSGMNYRQPLPSTAGINAYQSAQPYTSVAAPPLPPRPYASSNYGTQSSMYPSYGSSYGYGMGMGMGNYGGYNSYGGLGMGYGGYGSYRPGFGYGYGNQITPENRFIQIAEESARPAFESIQSVLGVLGSVTMMFESTFHAVHASYASVLGVADNFSKLRDMFGRFFSALAILRSMNWLYRRLLYLIGLSSYNPNTEGAWAAAMNEELTAGAGSAPSIPAGQPTKRWPALIFMAVIMAGPYLIFKLISKMNPEPKNENWNPREQPGDMYVAGYGFDATCSKELSFVPKQKLMIAPKQFQPQNAGWLLACDNTGRIGFVPGNYVLPCSSAQTQNIPATHSIPVPVHTIPKPEAAPTVQQEIEAPSTSSLTSALNNIGISAQEAPHTSEQSCPTKSANSDTAASTNEVAKS